jgi:transposase InsO family protein
MIAPASLLVAAGLQTPAKSFSVENKPFHIWSSSVPDVAPAVLSGLNWSLALKRGPDDEAQEAYRRADYCDPGTELTSNAILQWADDHKVAWHYIAPGKPVQNAFAESFIGPQARSELRVREYLQHPRSPPRNVLVEQAADRRSEVILGRARLLVLGILKVRRLR